MLKLAQNDVEKRLKKEKAIVAKAGERHLFKKTSAFIIGCGQDWLTLRRRVEEVEESLFEAAKKLFDAGTRMVKVRDSKDARIHELEAEVEHLNGLLERMKIVLEKAKELLLTAAIDQSLFRKLVAEIGGGEDGTEADKK